MIEDSRLEIEYRANSTITLESSASTPVWGAIFWETGVETPVHLVTAGVDPQQGAAVLICRDEKAPGGRSSLQSMTPVKALQSGEAALSSDCRPFSERSQVVAEGSTLTVHIPLNEVSDLSRSFEWVAYVGWRDTNTHAPRMAFLPEQPAAYDGWQPNRANFPQGEPEANTESSLEEE